MSQIDTPIQNEVPTLDTPIVFGQAFLPTSEDVENSKAIRAAYLDNYNTGKPIMDAYREHRGAYNKDATLASLSEQKLLEDTTATTEALEDIASSNPDVFVESVEAAVDLTAQQEAIANDPTKQFVDAVAGQEMEDEAKAAVANYIKLYELYAEATDDLTVGDYTLDFVAGLVPFRDTINEFNTVGGVLNNEEKIRTMILNYKSKPHQEQQEMFPDLAKFWIDGLGEIRGTEVLRKFIDPVTEDELSDFSNWWKLIDVVDMGSIAGTGVALAKLAKQSYNLPKVLARADNNEAAGDAVAVALGDKDAADAMNMQQETAFGDAVAFDISLEDPAYTKGLSTASQESIRKFFGEADKTVEQIMAGNGFLKEGILNSVERAIKEKAAYERLSKEKAEEIRIVAQTENTSTFKYKARDEDGNYFDEEFELNLTLNDVGQWDQSEIMTMSEFISSPTVFAKGLTKLDAATAQRLDSQTAMAFRQLTSLQSDIVKDLGSPFRPKTRARLAKVEKALREGDEFLNDNGTRGRVFNVEELQGQYGLDDAEIAVYYKTNRMYNNLWRLRNNSKREEMIARDYKQITISDETYSFGKQFDTAGDASNSLRTRGIDKVYDAVDLQLRTGVSRDMLDEQYALGKVLVEAPEGYNPGLGSGKYTHILVNAENVSELPSVVLNRKQGYVPRVSDNGFWFVKEMGEEMVNGQTTRAPVRTLRYFDNKTEADEYLLKERLKLMEEEGLTEAQAKERIDSFEDREQEIIATATGQFSHGQGGLYTAHRAEDEILFGLNGDKAQRITPYEALVRNIANVSRAVPINQWRLGLEQRWINTARQLLGTDIKAFNTLPDNVESTRAGEFLNKMAKQIRDWQGFPSKEEMLYQGMSQRLYEWAVEKGHKRGAKLFGWMRDKDPIAASRAAAFHSLLGWFNPAQLWVQAQGMSVAVSINMGKRLNETLKHTTALTMLGEAPVQGTTRFKLAAKAAGMSEDELAEIHRLWKKTGLEDSILQTADHAAAVRGHGIAMDAISRAADRGLFFYRGGELLNRRMSFTTALDELKAGELKGWEDFSGQVTDEALKAVLDRANNLMLNLGKANRAQWQKGILSIPTQFFQVSAKALETVTGANDQLTRAERLRMMAGQIALYGTAGVPLANMGTMYLMEAMGVTQEDIDNNPTLVKTWNDGFWGFVTLGVLGVDAEVSSRGSLIRGVTDFVDNWMYAESTAAEKLLGAFGSTGTRFWDEFTTSMRLITIGAYPTDAVSLAKLPTMPFLESISTWRNVEKAVFMDQMDAIFTKRGDVAVSRDFNIREQIMAAIGFQLSDETKAYSLEERTRAIQTSNNKIADLIIQRMNEAVQRDAMGYINDDFIQQTEEFYATLYNSLDWDRQQDVRDAVRRRIGAESREARAIRRYRDKVVGNAIDSLPTIRTLLLGTNIQSVDSPEETE